MTFNYDNYTDDELDPEKVQKLVVVEDGVPDVKFPIRFSMQKPLGPDGVPRDQTDDAANNMRYAAGLALPELKVCPTPRMGRAIIVGGAPSVSGQLGKIKALAADPENAVFALNWSHTWLLDNGVVPTGCVLFEIDAEPDSMLKRAHPEVIYFICSHCHSKTFDDLAGSRRVLWHSPPNSEGEKAVGEELFKDSTKVGGGIGTFTRTISIALCLGYRNIELFGCDSSFPDDAASTHVDGYETANVVETDAFYVYARKDGSQEMRRFKTVGYLALQVEEFKEYCRVNGNQFAVRVHGDSLLRYVHERICPWLYHNDPIKFITG